MSYKIIMSAQQLRVIQTALNNCPAQGETDEFDGNVLEVLKNLTQMTLEEPEDDCLHGWIV